MRVPQSPDDQRRLYPVRNPRGFTSSRATLHRRLGDRQRPPDRRVGGSLPSSVSTSRSSD